jgi:hypothetical protein
MAKKTEAKVTTKTVKAAAPKVRKPRAARKAKATTNFSKTVEGFETMQNKFKTGAAQAAEKATAMGKDVYAFNKANFDAAVEAGKVAVKGAQTASKHAVELGKKGWEANTAHAKAVAAVRTPTDLYRLQSDFARTRMNEAMSEMAKATQFNLKLAGDIAAPLMSRYKAVTADMKARYAA